MIVIEVRHTFLIFVHVKQIHIRRYKLHTEYLIDRTILNS